MHAPDALLWLLCLVFVAVAAPCVYRLVRAHPGSPLRCRVNRTDEAAELLMAAGMLAMVSPIGAPIPLAGWIALFGLAAFGLAAVWTARRRGLIADGCVGSTCGHHTVMAASMVFMLAAMGMGNGTGNAATQGASTPTGHDAAHGSAATAHGSATTDPWLVLADHDGSLGPFPLVVAVVAYCAGDLVVCGWRLYRAPREPGPALFGRRARLGARAVMSAAMGGMVLTMA